MIDKFVDIVARIKGWNNSTKRRKNRELREILHEFDRVSDEPIQFAIAVCLVFGPPLLGIAFIIRLLYVAYYNLT